MPSARARLYHLLEVEAVPNRRMLVAAALNTLVLAGCDPKGTKPSAGTTQRSSPAPTATSPTVTSPVPTPSRRDEVRALLVRDGGGLVLANRNGSGVVETAFDVSEGVRFAVSPDGRSVVGSNGKWIRIMNVAEPDRVIVLATEERAHYVLDDPVWSIDGSKLAYVLVHFLNPGSIDKKIDHLLYVVSRDGGPPRLVRQFRRPQYVVLKAFDRNRILWFETGPGGAEFNLTAVDVDTGRATRIPNRIPFENRGIVFDSRLRTAYLIDVQELAVKAAAVGRRSIKTLFEVRSPKVDSLGGRTRLLSLFLSPDGKSLFFTEHSEPDNREVTFVLDVVSRRTRVLLTHDQGAANNRALAASPDGRYIWLQADCPNCGGMDPQPPEYTVLDRTTGAVERFQVTAEIRLHFAGWVRT